MALRILYPMTGRRVGGSHLAAVELISALDRNEFEPVCALHNPGGELSDVAGSYLDASHIFVPRGIRDMVLHSGSVRQGIEKAENFLKDNAIDIVQCEDGPLRYIWSFAAQRAGASYVHYQQTIPAKSLEKKIFYTRFDACVSCSEAVRNALPTLPEKTLQHVIYPVFSEIQIRDKPASRRECLEILKLPADGTTRLIGFVANIRHQKRPLVFLEAAQALLSAGIDCHFFMCGAFYFETESELRAYVRDNRMEARVTFTGFQSDPLKWIAGADVLMVPAVGDAFGRTLVEAMACGTPVIAADSGGHPEIIDNGMSGFLASPDKVEDFVRYTMHLLENENLSNSITQAARRQEKFKPLNQVRAFENLYKEVLEKTRLQRSP